METFYSSTCIRFVNRFSEENYFNKVYYYYYCYHYSYSLLKVQITIKQSTFHAIIFHNTVDDVTLHFT